MNRRLLLAIGASALIIAGVAPAPALAAGPGGASRHVDTSKIDKSFQPMLAQPQRPVTVMLELAGQPAVRAGVTKSAQQSQAKSLRTAQAAVSAAVAKQGGKVLARYQYAYNGLRVRTTAGKLEALAAIPGVIAVRPIRVYERTNAIGVPAIGAPTAWQQTGATGAGVLVAVIDTGIDYTHANFGGPGTEGDFTGNDPATVEAGTFPTPKVVAGYDFAGNLYDADADDGTEVPVPDDDPLDCGGHGSHVAGTVAGMGVKADKSTYQGLYNDSTIGDGSGFAVAPGVAPEAKLVALKVFGCEGTTDLVVDALEWVAAYNVAHMVGIDVVNMSLGSPFGNYADPDAVATNNLVGAGVVVVASAGNEGAVPYITGAPAVASKAISVAALDAVPTLPMATIDLTAGNEPGVNMNAHPGLPVGATLDVLEDGSGGVKLGCDAADFIGTSGKIVAVKRGDCAFVDKGALAVDAGAVGIIVINRDDLPADALPTFLGYNPDVFDIPMIGTTNAVQAALLAADGEAATLSDAGTAANPTYNQITGFSSSGPRWGDSALKADVAAPGASIFSTAVGTGWNGTTISGTSMAAPMTAGAAALVVQAHPAWTPLKVKAALVNTADAASVVGYTLLRSGSGAIKVDRAAKATVVATTSDGTATLSYGYVQATTAWSSAKTITITNDGSQSAGYTLAASNALVKLSATSITVPAHSSVNVTATASRATSHVAAMCSPDPWVSNACSGLYSISGVVTATPKYVRAGQYTLRVPYLLVPRGASSVTSTRSTTWTKSGSKISGRINLANSSYHAGNADVYALGPTDASGDGRNGTDVRAAGVQVLPYDFLDDTADPSDRSIVFAVNMHDRFSTAAPHEIDVAVDTDGDTLADYFVFGYDYGAMTTGAYSGMYVSFVYDVALDTITNAWLADAPLNGSTVLLPALASDLGLAAGAGAFTYKVVSYDGYTAGASDSTYWSRSFDAYAAKQSNGQFKKVNARSSTYISAWFYRVSTVRGWLVVSMDDRNGSYQADVVSPPSKP